MHRGIGPVVLAASVIIVGACGKTEANQDQSAGMGEAMTMTGQMAPGAVEYRVVFRSTWTAANHPFEYPAAGALSGPHFSGLIGASHGAGYTAFAAGSLPTPGLERLSEEGKHSPLDAELRAAMGADGVGAAFTTGPLRDFGDSIVATVRVDAAHPLVSLVAMIAPSPDWFTGAANVALWENEGWVTSRTIALDAWDSGGDDGATYKAADRDTDPKKPTARAMTRHFVSNGTTVPVATVTFTRM